LHGVAARPVGEKRGHWDDEVFEVIFHVGERKHQGALEEVPTEADPVKTLEIAHLFVPSVGRPLTTTIIVDNSILAFACNITNGVPIPSYFGQPWDNEL